MSTRYLLLLVSICAASASAQRLSFGIQRGAPAQPPLQGATSSLPFLLGPTVSVRAPEGFSLESGLLFYRLGKRSDTVAFPLPENALTLGLETWRGRALEIPFLVKYKFLAESHGWHPFVVAGPAVRRTSLDFTGVSTVFGAPLQSPAPQPGAQENSVKWNVDPVAGAGVSFRTGRITLEPQVRYSHWGAGKNSPVLKNQVNFLFGFRL